MAVQLDPQLLDILACPSEDHAALAVGTPDDPDADALTCTECGRIYPVEDGVPVLLLDAAAGAQPLRTPMPTQQADGDETQPPAQQGHK